MIETVCKHCRLPVHMRRNDDGTVWILHPAPLCEGARRTIEAAGGTIEKLGTRDEEKSS